jgi:hypothetical protein
MAKKEVASLATMIGTGELWEVQGKNYMINPLKIKDEPEFTGDDINFGVQYFSLINPEERVKVDKWMERYLFDKSGEPMSLEKVAEADWDVADLKEFWHRLVRISG